MSTPYIARRDNNGRYEIYTTATALMEDFTTMTALELVGVYDPDSLQQSHDVLTAHADEITAMLEAISAVPPAPEAPAPENQGNTPPPDPAPEG